jgi:hypothetical protein
MRRRPFFFVPRFTRAPYGLGIYIRIARRLILWVR